ncbi:MAG TPA: hypothetical protein VNS12_06050 [Pelagibacterium sp.]|uniref:hypothetical protein n=1 Tax=Pelagibacterium sp. TaxID=1967288 RepID=UPI002C1E024E|nr:hypothetical protein [Pelagibacterium sp.]HWJ87612.1 hypothetical protein [Pelagibacterium sp.]
MQPEPGRTKKKKVATGIAGEGSADILATGDSRFLPLSGIFSQFARAFTARDEETEKDGGEFETPPELVPGFMPTVRRVLSRFLNPRKRQSAKNRRKRGWRALLARFAHRSKFMTAPTAPKPSPQPKAAPASSSPSPKPLRGTFNKPKGP